MCRQGASFSCHIMVALYFALLLGDARYSPGIGANCGTCGLVVTKMVGRVELAKSFLGMETGEHLYTDANLFYRVDKWRFEPGPDVVHMDLSGRDVPVRACAGVVVRGGMCLLG